MADSAGSTRNVYSILSSSDTDFLIRNNGDKIPVSELEGKTIGLYFSATSSEFNPQLVEVYEKLKTKGRNFEVVLIPHDEEEESFKQGLPNVPWLSLSFKDKRCGELARFFKLSILPKLVIIGPDGKTLHSNAVEAIEGYGIDAYPFTPERFAELIEIEKAEEATQTLESILLLGDQDFVIGKNGVKVPVSELVGKSILLYFTAHWCSPCLTFLPKLVEAYHKIKAKDNAFEVIFISSDLDQDSFDEFFGGMPWLALPFDDISRKASLSRKFKASRIPMLVAIGSSGRTLTKEARDLVDLHGADAYPFTKERIEEIEAKYEGTAKGLPEKVKHESHEHELVLTRHRIYDCEVCEDEGQIWSYYCEDCDFDVHPKCVLGEKMKQRWMTKRWMGL